MVQVWNGQASGVASCRAAKFSNLRRGRWAACAGRDVCHHPWDDQPGPHARARTHAPSCCHVACLLARSFASLSTTHSQRCIVTHPGESSLVTRRVRAVDNTRAPEYHVDGAQHLRKRRGVPARASQRRRCFRLLSCESPPEKWRCCACTLKTRIKT